MNDAEFLIKIARFTELLWSNVKNDEELMKFADEIEEFDNLNYSNDIKNGTH